MSPGIGGAMLNHRQVFKSSYIKTLKAQGFLSFLADGPVGIQRFLVCKQFGGKSLLDEAINRRSGWIFSLAGVPQSFYSGLILFLFLAVFFLLFPWEGL